MPIFPFVWRLVLLPIFICLSRLAVTAQSSWKPGYIITVAHDTLHGFIDYNRGNYTPDKIYFKERLSSKLTKYTVQDLVAFNVTGYDRFIAGDVIRHNPIMWTFPAYVGDGQSSSQTFLRVVAEGTLLHLYTCEKPTDGHPRFFIRANKPNADFKELIYWSSEDYHQSWRNPYLHDFDRGDDGYQIPAYYGYRQLLSTFDSTNFELKNYLYQLPFDEQSLLNAVCRLNGVRPSKITFPKVKPYNSFFVSVGLTANRFYQNLPYVLDKLSLHAGVGQVYTLGYDFGALKHPRTLLRLAVSYDYFKANRDGPVNDLVQVHNYRFSVGSLGVHVGYLYQLINYPGRFRLYGGIEASYRRCMVKTGDKKFVVGGVDYPTGDRNSSFVLEGFPLNGLIAARFKPFDLSVFYKLTSMISDEGGDFVDYKLHSSGLTVGIHID